MRRRSTTALSACAGFFSFSRASGFICVPGNVVRGRRCQEVRELAASPIENFFNGLADMMTPQTPEGRPLEELSEGFEQEEMEQRDMNEFRRGLIKQARNDFFRKQEEFTGYDMYDLIVDKFEVPYDITINKTIFAGKPVLCLNVMWKYLGQSSFHLSKQEYLEHLEALAQLLKEWDRRSGKDAERVDQFKRVLAETKKRPNPYFGYAVALPLDLAPDTLTDYFDDSYFR